MAESLGLIQFLPRHFKEKWGVHGQNLSVLFSTCPRIESEAAMRLWERG